MDRLDPQDAIELIDERLRLLREQLQVYKDMRKTGEDSLACLGNPLNLQVKLLTLDSGIMHAKASIKWCEKVKKALRSHI